MNMYRPRQAHRAQASSASVRSVISRGKRRNENVLVKINECISPFDYNAMSPPRHHKITHSQKYSRAASSKNIYNIKHALMRLYSPNQKRKTCLSISFTLAQYFALCLYFCRLPACLPNPKSKLFLLSYPTCTTHTHTHTYSTCIST